MARSSPTIATSEDAHAVAWRLHRVTEEATRTFESISARHDLTAVQARSLLRLGEPTRMQDLAQHLRCDPSNVTGIAERLTERGLVTWRPGEDRRVKLLELTPTGTRIRAKLARDVATRSLPMTNLSLAERAQLVVLLDKLLAGLEEC